MNRRRPFALLSVILLGLYMVGACGQPPAPTPGMQALFGDHDLVTATGSPATEVADTTFTLAQVFTTLIETDDRVPTITTSSRVLPEAQGVIAFVQHDTRVPASWRVFVHDQVTDERTLVYQGTREIESVATTADASTVVFAARAPGDDLEVFRLTLAPRSVERLTFTVYDETNVSISADGSLIAWEGVGFFGQRSVYVRSYDEHGGYTEQRLAQPLDQVEPRLTSNGRFLALVQVQANGRRDVLRFDLHTRTYDVAYRTQLHATHPSSSDDGASVAFVLHDPGFHRILIRDLTDGTLDRAVANAHGIGGAHLASDGRQLAFTLWQLGTRSLGGTDIFTRDLTTGEQSRLTSYATTDVNHPNHFWATTGTPTQDAPRNIALATLGATTGDNGYFQEAPYLPTPSSNVIDGDPTTYWAGLAGVSPQMVWVHFDQAYEISRVDLDEMDVAYVNTGLLEYHDGSTWMPLTTIDKDAAGLSYEFAPVVAVGVRLSVDSSTAPASWTNKVACVYAIEVLGVAVDGPPPPEAPAIVTFAATPEIISQGGSSTLSWIETGAEPIALSITPDVGDVTGLASVEVSPLVTTTYTLTATNAAGSATASVTVVVSDGPGPAPMILEVDTTLSEGTTVTLPLRGEVDVTIDWGDGSQSSASSADDVSHVYAVEGAYTISIAGSLTQFGSGWNHYPNAEKLMAVTDWGDLGLTSLWGAFYGATNLTVVPDDLPPTVTNMSGMFAGASTFDHPVESWNTSNVTNMANMFRWAAAFNQPIDTWDTSNVTDMNYMFNGAAAFNQPIGAWDTGNLTFMNGMFFDAAAFNQSIGAWDTSKVTNMNGVFRGAAAFNQPIYDWDTRNVTDMHSMFMLATTFNQPIGTWNTDSVTRMGHMFWGATAFDQAISAWDTRNVTDMAGMFLGASTFNRPVGVWNTSNVTDMNYMFNGAAAFNQPIGAWDTSNVTFMDGMFSWAAAFNQDLSGWCVTLIPSEPEGFATEVESWTLPKPEWGTCPGSDPHPEYLTLTATTLGEGTGHVASVPAGIDCGTACQADFVEDTVVTLVATPGANSTFTGWTGCDAQEGTTCTVSLSTPRTVSATFGLEPVGDGGTLAVSVVPSDAEVRVQNADSATVHLGVGAVSLSLPVGAYGIRVSATGFVTQNHGVEVLLDQTTSVSYTLEPEQGHGAIRVRVLDHDGSPRSLATVRLWEGGDPADGVGVGVATRKTDAAGYVTFEELPAGPYSYSVWLQSDDHPELLNWEAWGNERDVVATNGTVVENVFTRNFPRLLGAPDYPASIDTFTAFTLESEVANTVGLDVRLRLALDRADCEPAPRCSQTWFDSGAYGPISASGENVSASLAPTGTGTYRLYYYLEAHIPNNSFQGGFEWGVVDQSSPFGTLGFVAGPTAPSLTANTSAPDAIELFWYPVAGAHAYEIYHRRTQDPSAVILAALDGERTSYPHEGLTPNSGHCYYLLAIGSDGTSEPSAEVCLSTGSALGLAVYFTNLPSAGSINRSQTIGWNSTIAGAEFRYRLDVPVAWWNLPAQLVRPFVNKWSDWGPTQNVQFSNLSAEGKYTMAVEARSPQARTYVRRVSTTFTLRENAPEFSFGTLPVSDVPTSTNVTIAASVATQPGVQYRFTIDPPHQYWYGLIDYIGRWSDWSDNPPQQGTRFVEPGRYSVTVQASSSGLTSEIAYSWEQHYVLPDVLEHGINVDWSWVNSAPTEVEEYLRLADEYDRCAEMYSALGQARHLELVNLEPSPALSELDWGEVFDVVAWEYLQHVAGDAALPLLVFDEHGNFSVTGWGASLFVAGKVGEVVWTPLVAGWFAKVGAATVLGYAVYEALKYGAWGVAHWMADQDIRSYVSHAVNCAQQSAIHRQLAERLPELLGYSLRVSLAGTGSGWVDVNPPGTRCQDDCVEHHPTGTTVQLIAEPASGHAFGGWAGACASFATTPTCTLTMDGDTDVAAMFELGNQPPQIVEAEGPGNGTTGSVFSWAFKVSDADTPPENWRVRFQLYSSLDPLTLYHQADLDPIAPGGDPTLGLLYSLNRQLTVPQDTTYHWALIVSDNDPRGSLGARFPESGYDSFTVSATVPSCTWRASPTSITGSAYSSQTPSPSTFRLYNDGNVPCAYDVLSFPSFVQNVSPRNGTLESGAYHQIRVDYFTCPSYGVTQSSTLGVRGDASLNVPVTYSCNATADWRASASNVRLSASIGDVANDRTFTLYNDGMPANYTISLQGGGSSMFSVTPTSGSLGGGSVSMRVSATTSCPISNLYRADLVVAGGNDTLTVPLELDCQGASWATTPTNVYLTFVGTAGGPKPADQSFLLRNQGAVDSSFSVSVTYLNTPTGWLTVSPTSGYLRSLESASLLASVATCQISRPGFTDLAEIRISGGGATRTVGVSRTCN